MSIFEMTLAEAFALLFIAMGPVRVVMSYMPIACNLAPAMQRKLAWRTFVAGLIVVVVLLAIGKGMVQNFRLNQNVLLMAVGVAYVAQALAILLTRQGDISSSSQMRDPLWLALSPLAVPAMITPLGVAMLLSVSAFVSDLMSILVFFGLVVAILAIDFGAMLLSTYVAQYITRPVLEVFQKIFGFVLLAFGLRLVLGALAKLGVIVIKGL